VFVGDQDGLVGEIEEFLTGVRHQQPVDRTLATIMFADIVSSTELAAKLGDQRWADLLERYYAIVRKQLTAFRGHEIKTLGDGVLATFDGPARAIRSARAIREEVKGVGIDVRIGLHTGECELLDNDIGGIAVHIADRVAATAQSAEVLVSSTVKDLVVGSGIQFADRGAHDLKGVPGQWQLYLVQ
jgi:class 3 adenylate cyclase